MMLVDNCYVTCLERDGARVSTIFVSYQGRERRIDVPAGGKVFLALGTIENTRLARNTVPEKNLIGRDLMAHLRSNLTIRVPRAAFGAELDPGQEPDPIKKQLLRELQISALFVKGIHTHADGSVKTLADPQSRIASGAPDGNGVPRAKVRLETNWSDPADPRITDQNDRRRTKDNDLWAAMG